MKNINIVYCLLVFTLIVGISSNCSFVVENDGTPIKVNTLPYMVHGLSQCKQYNDKLGCCNQNNDKQQQESYQSIDGIFGSDGDGCDICAINLKRFWCEYACSPEQASFTQISDDYTPMPDPQRPDQIIMVQKLNLTVNADTACSLFNSCSRNSFVSAVSAMGTPAGFLSFLGGNSVHEAKQYMTIQFTYNKSGSIYFGKDHPDQNETQRYEAFDLCNRTIGSEPIQIHQFEMKKNCTCNNCGLSCNASQGFIYSDSSVFQEFNYWLVGITWGVVIVIACGLTFYRMRKQEKNITGEEKKQM